MRVTKRCGRCGRRKRIHLFNRASRNPDGLRSECRACQTEDGRAYISRPKVLERQRLYSAAWHADKANRDGWNARRRAKYAKERG